MGRGIPNDNVQNAKASFNAKALAAKQAEDAWSMAEKEAALNMMDSQPEPEIEEDDPWKLIEEASELVEQEDPWAKVEENPWKDVLEDAEEADPWAGLKEASEADPWATLKEANEDPWAQVEAAQEETEENDVVKEV